MICKRGSNGKGKYPAYDRLTIDKAILLHELFLEICVYIYMCVYIKTLILAQYFGLFTSKEDATVRLPASR